MSKQGGLGARFLVGGYNLSGDIQALDKISGGPALWDTTDITQFAHSRVGTLRDGSMSFTEFMDAADAHPVLSALPVTDELMTFLVAALAVGAPAACLNAKQIGYDGDRGADASLLLKTQGLGNGYGLEWGLALTAGLRTDTSATDGAVLDGGASSAHGAQCYLQVTAFTGTDCTITVEHSTNNFSTHATLGAFTEVTAAPFTQRLAVAGTVDEYVRVSTSTSGGFTGVTFAVVFCRNPVAVSF